MNKLRQRQNECWIRFLVYRKDAALVRQTNELFTHMICQQMKKELGKYILNKCVCACEWLADNIEWNVYIFICSIWNAISIDVWNRARSVNAERCSLESWHFSMHTHTRTQRGEREETAQTIPVRWLLPYRTCPGTNKCRVSLICFAMIEFTSFHSCRRWSSKHSREFYGLLVYGSSATSFVVFCVVFFSWLFSPVTDASCLFYFLCTSWKFWIKNCVIHPRICVTRSVLMGYVEE